MLDFLFSPLLVFDPSLAIVIFSVIILFLINLGYKFLINQDEAKRIKGIVKEINDRAKEEQKKGNTDKMNELFKEAMQENSKMMKMSMKPMLISFLIVILLIPFLTNSYGDSIVAFVPVVLPFIGNELGWLMWYIIVSIPVALLIRKLMKISI